MDGHPRQNPAYRPANGKPRKCGAFLFTGALRPSPVHHQGNVAHGPSVCPSNWRARREGRSMALLVLDFDRFKVFNDVNGHQAGDQLPRESADAWTQELRQTDFLARYGGDEFCALLPNCTATRRPASQSDSRTPLHTASLYRSDWPTATATRSSQTRDPFRRRSRRGEPRPDAGLRLTRARSAT